MKKLIAVMAVGLMSTSAMASTARITVMGDGFGNFGSSGSMYYNDNYNVFYNPAYVNDFTNWVSLEKAGANSFAGGVVGMGGMNIGLFLNRGATAFGSSSPFTVMVGGDAGVKWGVGLEWGHQDITDGKNELMLRAGVTVGDVEPFANFRILSEDAAGNKFGDMGAGLRYHWGEWTPFVRFQSTNTEPAAGGEFKTTDLGLGIGRSTKMKEGVMLNYAVAFIRDLETDDNTIPVTIGVEADAASWLTIRGGFTFGAEGQNTLARVGASIKVAGANLDWAFGGANGGPVADYANVDANNFDLGAGFFTNVGLTYNW